jgi:MFS family permease
VIHRAVVGPLIATAFLFFLPGQYRLLFALTAIPGALAVWTLFRVPEEARDAPVPAHLQPSTGGVLALPRRFYGLMGILVLFSLGNSADAFLLLRLSAVLGRDAYIPLLWAALHVVKASLSMYGGALSDRVGRKAVIVSGWAVYALVYLGFAVVESVAGLIGLFLVYGIYFGLAEGTEKALVTDLSPARRLGTAFGIYNAAIGIGALAASVLFGVLYDKLGKTVAFGTGAALAAAAALFLLLLPTGSERREVAV